MRLSKRIYSIAGKVQQGETAADIGTDHGYVPMLLMRNKVSPAVIMSDISDGSLKKAIETFELAGITVDPTCFRVGDGLTTICEGEVDDIIIAGLGGFTIIEILKSDIQKSRSFSKLILQPRKYSGDLRFFLYTHGWDITDEDLAPEGKFVCEIITAVPSGVLHREAPYPEGDIRWKYPDSIVLADHDLAAKRIGWKIGSITEQIENLRNSNADHSDLITQLVADREYLTELIR
ncbi:MAG: SAM-dependent methyltransferase [Mogibacterium sp.]|nr:SAM-dependent methyltransferase [Mogibacterium sp.]